MNGGQQFEGNIQSQGELISKVERELAANFIGFNETDYILSHWKLVYNSLTTTQLRSDFINAINKFATIQNVNIQSIGSGRGR